MCHIVLRIIFWYLSMLCYLSAIITAGLKDILGLKHLCSTTRHLSLFVRYLWNTMMFSLTKNSHSISKTWGLNQSLLTRKQLLRKRKRVCISQQDCNNFNNFTDPWRERNLVLPYRYHSMCLFYFCSGLTHTYILQRTAYIKV